jgi:hypothetical protein
MGEKEIPGRTQFGNPTNAIYLCYVLLGCEVERDGRIVPEQRDET